MSGLGTPHAAASAVRLADPAKQQHIGATGIIKESKQLYASNVTELQNTFQTKLQKN